MSRKVKDLEALLAITTSRKGRAILKAGIAALSDAKTPKRRGTPRKRPNRK